MTRPFIRLNTSVGSGACGDSISPTTCRSLKFDQNHRSVMPTAAPEITIAVVGPSGVGKSNFMKHALDLESPPTSPMVFKKVSLDGSIFRVRLLEINIQSISYDDTCNEIIWPEIVKESINGQSIDGILNLFDSSDLTTITKHPRFHQALPEIDIPSITVACKCDCECLTSEETFVSARQVLGPTKVQQAACDEPTTQKRCISAIVGAVIRRTRLSVYPSSADRPRSSLSSRRGILTLHTPMNRDSHFHSSKWGNYHSVSKPPSYPSPVTPISPKSFDHSSPPSTSTSLSSPSRTALPQNDLPTQPPPFSLHNGSQLSSDFADSRSSHRLSTPGTLDSDFGGSKRASYDSWSSRTGSGTSSYNSSSKAKAFPDSGDDKMTQEEKKEEKVAQLPQPSLTELNRSPPSDSGQTFDQLIDRLIAQPNSKNEIHFRFTFLCFYRLFATPKKLLLTLIKRFELAGDDSIFYIAQFAEQIQVLEVLTQWVFEHPGDLSSRANKARIKNFLGPLETNMMFAFSAKEISNGLQQSSEDLDGSWAVTTDTDRTQSSAVSRSNLLAGDVAQDDFYELEEDCHVASALDLEGSGEDVDNFSTRVSTASVTSHDSHKPEGPMKETLSSWLRSDGDYQAFAEAQSIEITDDLPLTKDLHRAFFDTEDEVIAHEIYRMDWAMYKSFRPREMFRYVNMPTAKKCSDESVANVSRMVTIFNRLASFVVTMVLSRSKAKSRAATMEKFMRIAILLRQLNDYNSLGAVIAGLEQEPIYRLTQCQELIDTTVRKQFRSLKILMGHDRAYRPYRLAWDNTSSARICYLPLHLRDLTAVGEGNKTFIDPAHSQIKWRKFEILGENLLQLYRSQTTPPDNIRPKNQFIRNMILRTKVKNEMEVTS